MQKIRNRPIRVDIAGKEGGRDGGMTRGNIIYNLSNYQRKNLVTTVETSV